MARISGVDIPNEKRLDIGLTYIYGIGRSNVNALLKEVQVEPHRRVHTLTDEEISKIAKAIDKLFRVEGDLRQEVSSNIKRLKEIGAYRGTRHAKNLPTRGQRTKSNARTKRGKRSTVGAQKKDDRIKQTETKTEPSEKK
jgi:small subunit ribosomal protein S13